MSLIKAKEYLENADYNCNNLKKEIRASLFLEIIQEQIQSAIKEIEKELADEEKDE
jgi:hypothetical protein